MQTLQLPDRLIAVDWSGAQDVRAQRRGIQLAERRGRAATNGTAIQLTGGRVRGEVEAVLLAMAERREPVVVGLDFSFSYPEWFVRKLGCESAPELWARVAEEGEAWLLGTSASWAQRQFWGRRKGSKQPPGHRAPQWLGYRACERALAAVGRLPSSSFQIGGAGAVGTGTLRGMPMLLRLRSAGWSVWPFDEPRLPMLLEVYPRLLTGTVVKSRMEARREYLAQNRFCGVSAEVLRGAEASEDAFDAVIAALAMYEHRAQLAQLRQAQNEQTRREGAIWHPLSRKSGFAQPLLADSLLPQP